MQREKWSVWRNQTVSNEDKTEGVDQVLALLSEPLSRYILSVLAGVDPGAFAGSLEFQEEEDEKNNVKQLTE